MVNDRVCIANAKPARLHAGTFQNRARVQNPGGVQGNAPEDPPGRDRCNVTGFYTGKKVGRLAQGFVDPSPPTYQLVIAEHQRCGLVPGGLAIGMFVVGAIK